MHCSVQVKELVSLHLRLVADEQQSISEAFAKVRSLQMDFLNSHQAEPSGDILVPDLLSKMSTKQKAQIEKEVNAFHENARRLINVKIFDLFISPDMFRISHNLPS